jgi:murein DD-endopeptidase MepM/ murein hydrolase activator NlpD
VLPIACEYGKTCFIQNYADRDPGPGRIDYACGRLTYDGHGGSDFRLRDYVEMEKRYTVLAAAPGVVKATRDGMEDVSIAEIGGRDAVRGREGGNGVVIDHGGGWTTQYSHMRKGSVAVRPGDVVRANQVLGLIGLSGRTEFPHLDFMVRHNGAEVDPFVGKDHPELCAGPRTPMWTPEVAKTLIYIPTGLLVASFADAVPEPEAARHGAFRLSGTVRDPDALLLWADLFGVQKGDIESFTITGPDGRDIFDKARPLSDSRVSWFGYSGIKRPREGWVPGTYKGVYRLTRDGEVIAKWESEVVLTR